MLMAVPLPRRDESSTRRIITVSLNSEYPAKRPVTGWRPAHPASRSAKTRLDLSRRKPKRLAHVYQAPHILLEVPGDVADYQVLTGFVECHLDRSPGLRGKNLLTVRWIIHLNGIGIGPWVVNGSLVSAIELEGHCPRPVDGDRTGDHLVEGVPTRLFTLGAVLLGAGRVGVPELHRGTTRKVCQCYRRDTDKRGKSRNENGQA